MNWNLRLGDPPEPVQMGIGVHGRSDGPSAESYRLPDLWCLHLYGYEGEVEIAGRSFALLPGRASLIPPDTPMTYRYRGPSAHFYCHFRAGESGPEIAVPAMQELGSRFRSLDERLRRVGLSSSVPGERRRAALWEVLWELGDAATTSAADASAKHPVVERAIAEIESRLAEPLSVAEIAERAGVSYSYLGRLFQASLGENVIGYIQRRRAERAEHLLRFSTLPIKSIAFAVGVADLQRFNRLIHRACGCSPRALRSERVTPLSLNSLGRS